MYVLNKLKKEELARIGFQLSILKAKHIYMYLKSNVFPFSLAWKSTSLSQETCVLNVKQDSSWVTFSKLWRETISTDEFTVQLNVQSLIKCRT